MTPQDLITEMQTILGDGYKVSAHPTKRAEPQFDVFPEPRQHDARGNPYRVTFSVRSKDLASVPNPSLFAAQYAVAADKDITLQITKGKAAPVWPNQ